MKPGEKKFEARALGVIKNDKRGNFLDMRSGFFSNDAVKRKRVREESGA